MRVWRGILAGVALFFLGFLAWGAGEVDVFSAGSVTPEKALIQKMIDRHIVAAAEYRDKAKAMQAFMEQHRKMLKDYEQERRAATSEAFGVSTTEMGKHCQAIIRNARALQEECEAFAAWHEQRAQALRQRLEGKAESPGTN